MTNGTLAFSQGTPECPLWCREYSFKYRAFSSLIAVIVLSMMTGIARAQTLSLVTSQAALNSNDNVSWTQLGEDGQTLGSSFKVTSTNANSVTVNLNGTNSVTAVSCPAPSCSWAGSGMPSGDTLIWTSDLDYGGNGPLTAVFENPQSAVGAFIQSDGPAQFTARIQTLDGEGTSLGTFTETSDSNGDAVFIGIVDNAGAQISSVVFSLTNAKGPTSDFALDTLFLSGPVLPTPTASIAPSTAPTLAPSATPISSPTGTTPLTVTPTASGVPTPTVTPTTTATTAATSTMTMTPTATLTSTATLTATATVTATAIPTIPPPTATPTMTPTLTATWTPTMTATATPTATPTTEITFVGSGPLADYNATVSNVNLILPQGVQSGDTLLAQIVIYDGDGSDVPTLPSGWNNIRHDSIGNGLKATSWLYYKTASVNEPNSYSWNINSNWVIGAMEAWRGTSNVPVDNSSGTTAGGTLLVSASAPSLTPSHNGELEVYYFGSQSNSGPILTLSGYLNPRFNSTSSKEGFALAVGDLPAPFAGNSSPPYPATASISGTAVMTAQAVLLLPGSVSPSPSPTGTNSPTPIGTATSRGTATPTIAATMSWTPTTIATFTSSALPTSTLTETPVASPTSTATPGLSNIVFVGAGALADYSSPVTTVLISRPTGIQTGDVLLAQVLVYDGNGTNVPTPPSGWNSVRHDSVNNGNQATSWTYYKIAGANEPSSYGWSISSSWAAGVIGAWRGVAASPLDNSSGSALAGASPVFVSAPSLTPLGNNELLVFFYGGQSHSGPTLTLSNALNQRFNQSSSKEGFSLAFADVTASSPYIPSPIYPAAASSSSGAAATAQGILLVPATQNATPIPTTAPTTIPTGTAIPTVMSTGAPTPTVAASPMPTPFTTPSTIVFVGTGSLADSSVAVSTVSLGVPSGLQSGDVMLAQIVVYDGTGSDVPTSPSGWMAIRHDSVGDANRISSWLFYKAAGTDEPSSYLFTISSNWAAGVMAAWRGASTLLLISSGSAVSGASPVSVSAPSLTPTGNNELEVHFYGSQSYSGPNVTLSNALNQRFNTASSKEGFTIAVGDLMAPPAGNPSATYPATANISGKCRFNRTGSLVGPSAIRDPSGTRPAQQSRSCRAEGERA